MPPPGSPPRPSRCCATNTSRAGSPPCVTASSSKSSTRCTCRWCADAARHRAMDGARQRDRPGRCSGYQQSLAPFCCSRPTQAPTSLYGKNPRTANMPFQTGDTPGTPVPELTTADSGRPARRWKRMRISPQASNEARPNGPNTRWVVGTTIAASPFKTAKAVLSYESGEMWYPSGSDSRGLTNPGVGLIFTPTIGPPTIYRPPPSASDRCPCQ